MSNGELPRRKYIDQLVEIFLPLLLLQKERMPKYEKITHQNENNSDEDDRNDSIYGSLELDFSKLNRNDAMSLLKQMPNKRYSELIRLRYLEQNTNEETAKALGMTMENYYSKHKLAKEQYQIIQRKEANNG